MIRLARQTASSTSKDTIFYAYVLGCVINIQWDVETITDKSLVAIVREFLYAIYGEDEWARLKLLDVIRDKSRNKIKEEARAVIPSIFAGRAAWPLAKPKETPNALFDIQLINRLRDTVDQLRKVEVSMEESTNEVSNAKAPRLVLPAGTTIDNLTIDNFRAITGRRFRVSTTQQERIKAGVLTREQAFAEFLEELKKENQS